jgi:hypothetical protein
MSDKQVRKRIVKRVSKGDRQPASWSLTQQAAKRISKKKKEIVEREATMLVLVKLVVPHKMLGTVGEPQKVLSLAWNAPSWS